MGLIGKLKKMITGVDNTDPNSNNPFFKQIKQCMVTAKLTRSEYELASMVYYKGYTSYRSFYKLVYFRKIKKITAIMKQAQEKALNGCEIDLTFVRFIHDEKRFFDIPFEVFSNKKDLTSASKRSKGWDRDNINRILSANPKMKIMDESMIKEVFRTVIIECLKG